MISPAGLAFAQTYAYINQDGELRVEEANTPAEAIRDAYRRAPNSGVMEISEKNATSIVPADVDTETYAYVSTSGALKIQVAETPQEAIADAPDRAPDSGVMLISK
jgi:hypothetical protein